MNDTTPPPVGRPSVKACNALLAEMEAKMAELGLDMRRLRSLLSDLSRDVERFIAPVQVEGRSASPPAGAPEPEEREAAEAASDFGSGVREHGFGWGAMPGMSGIEEAGLNFAASPAPGEAEAEEERDHVRQAVEQVRAELAAGAATAGHEAVSAGAEPLAAEPAEADEEREQVRQAVEQARADLLAGATSEDPVAAPGDENELQEKEADQAPELEAATQARAEASEPESDEDEARDEVRRAVEQARAELESTKPESIEEDRPMTLPASLPTHAVQSAAPIIVVDDPDGRVELAGVYEMLGFVGMADQASLLNYTHYSATVGINSLKLPEPQAFGEAAEKAFGRPCTCQNEGGRLTLRLGSKDAKSA